jgi:hypothetical protein
MWAVANYGCLGIVFLGLVLLTVWRFAAGEPAWDTLIGTVLFAAWIIHYLSTR